MHHPLSPNLRDMRTRPVSTQPCYVLQQYHGRGKNKFHEFHLSEVRDLVTELAIAWWRPHSPVLIEDAHSWPRTRTR
jgi:hypothetical protein